VINTIITALLIEVMENEIQQFKGFKVFKGTKTSPNKNGKNGKMGSLYHYISVCLPITRGWGTSSRVSRA
jgi:hypothetical protein